MPYHLWRHTLATFHAFKGWFKLQALLNMVCIAVPLETFHAPKGWLKLLASLNMGHDNVMLVVLETFHAPKDWLKPLAPSRRCSGTSEHSLHVGILFMVTLATSHPEMASLKSRWPANRSLS